MIIGTINGDKVWRQAIEVPADEDKHDVILIGLLPVIFADAARRGRSVVWLAPDSSSEARVQNRMHELFIMNRPEVGMWYHLEPIPENNFRSMSLEKLWIVGDLDWSDKPITSYHGEAVVKAVNRVLSTGSCPALLVHQQGKTPIVPFPPEFGTGFGTGSGGCFIATAVCGESSVEVERLRRFREAVLRQCAAGRWLISFYERVSPMLATRINGCRWLRELLRHALIGPLATIVGGLPRRRE